MERQLELGLDTFGDITTRSDGTPRTHAEVIRDVVDEAVLAGFRARQWRGRALGARRWFFPSAV